jgi:hypothetical protein
LSYLAGSMHVMANWEEIAAAEPDFAARAWALLDAQKHKVLATVRKDGGPRVSGIEVSRKDEWLWFGSMPGAVKARDLKRDQRFALHGGSPDPPEDPTTWSGDVKLAGWAIEVTDPDEARAYMDSGDNPPGPADVFRLDVSEVVITRVGTPADHLVIELWQEGVGLRQFQRA